VRIGARANEGPELDWFDSSPTSDSVLPRRRPRSFRWRLWVERLRDSRSSSDREPQLERELRHACGSDPHRDASSRGREGRLASGPVLPEPDSRHPLHHAPAFPGRDVVRARAVSDLVLARSARARQGRRNSESAYPGRSLQPCSSPAPPAWTRLVGRVLRTRWAPGWSPDPRRFGAIRGSRTNALGALRRIPLCLGAGRPPQLTARWLLASVTVRVKTSN
jgi:hypothetical protein